MRWRDHIVRVFCFIFVSINLTLSFCANSGIKEDREDSLDIPGQGSPGGTEKARRREGGGGKDEKKLRAGRRGTNTR